MVPQCGLIEESLLATRAWMGEVPHVLLQMLLVARFRCKVLITQNALEVFLENKTLNDCDLGTFENEGGTFGSLARPLPKSSDNSIFILV